MQHTFGLHYFWSHSKAAVESGSLVQHFRFVCSSLSGVTNDSRIFDLSSFSPEQPTLGATGIFRSRSKARLTMMRIFGR